VPVEVVRNHEETVVVARFFGRLTEPDIKRAIQMAFATGRAEPGLDRIVIIEPTAEVHELDSAALRRIQTCVHHEEVRGSAEVSFRSVFVHSSPLHTPLLRLYKAIWDELALPGVEFHVASSLAEASRLLGVRPPPLNDLSKRK